MLCLDQVRNWHQLEQHLTQMLGEFLQNWCWVHVNSYGLLLIFVDNPAAITALILSSSQEWRWHLLSNTADQCWAVQQLQRLIH